MLSNSRKHTGEKHGDARTSQYRSPHLFVCFLSLMWMCFLYSDARADQDHMELHEWLQQLKDKTMSHLEVLMQKGDIQGPPYVMPDDIELTFLRKFIERHNTGTPHNPALRHLGPNAQHPHIEDSMEMSTPELSDPGYPPPGSVDQMVRLQPGMQNFLPGNVELVNERNCRPESASGVSSSSYAHSSGTSHRPHLIRPPSSPSSATYEQLIQEAQASGKRSMPHRITWSRGLIICKANSCRTPEPHFPERNHRPRTRSSGIPHVWKPKLVQGERSPLPNNIVMN